MERKNFLKNLFGGTLFLWIGGIIYTFLSYLGYTKREILPRVKIDAKGISPSRPALLKLGEEHIWVIQISENVFSALSATCTHKRCILDWDKEKMRFLCPCHKGIFDKEGNPIFGLPSKPLRKFNISKKGDFLIVSV